MIVLSSCSSYEIKNNIVVYKHWNEAVGSIVDTLNADATTFKVLKHSNYAKDKVHVFYEGKLIKKADAATFESLDDYYARDKYHGFYADEPILLSHGKNFKIINSYFSTDGFDVFYETKSLHVNSVKKVSYCK